MSQLNEMKELNNLTIQLKNCTDDDEFLRLNQLKADLLSSMATHRNQL